MNKLLLLFLLLAFTTIKAQQPAQTAATAPDYTLVSRNTKDSIHIDTKNKIYQDGKIIGKMSYSVATVNGQSTKTITVSLLNGTKVAEAFTEYGADTHLWHVHTLKDQQQNKITSQPKSDQEDVLWYLVKGFYL